MTAQAAAQLIRYTGLQALSEDAFVVLNLIRITCLGHLITFPSVTFERWHHIVLPSIMSIIVIAFWFGWFYEFLHRQTSDCS